MAVTQSTIERYTQSDPDVRLMLRVADDDALAFEELMQRHQNRVVGVLTHLVGHRDMAEDLAQDVFLRIYRARKRYVPGAKFTTWLFTITNNVASNALRSLARRKEVNVTPKANDQSGGYSLDQAALAASGLMPTRQLDSSEMGEVVRLAVQALNERQRMAVLLAKFEQLSYAEIGEIMDMTPQAVKSLLSRARANLREILEPYFQNDA